MTRKEITKLANQLMTKHGLVQQGWKFEFDDKVIKRAGLCDPRWKRISLTGYFADHETEFEIKDTILHEIAHALVGTKNGHNKIWKAKAIEIGGTGERCYHGKIGTNPEATTKRRTTIYMGTCPACGGQRKSKVRKRCSCGVCDKKYNPEFKIVWEVWQK
jgi:hypothetical protein